MNDKEKLIVEEREALFRSEVERLRLTADERRAIEWSINDQIEGGHQDHPTVKDVIATLRGLLARLGGGA